MARRSTRSLVRHAAAGLLLLCGHQVSAQSSFSAGAGPMGDFSLPMQSFAEKRFATVVRQRYDFSCGSAALATLLRYHYGGKQDEEAVFRGMWAEGDRAQIRRLGFSLLDMKRYLATLGLNADGFQVTLDEVAAAGVPGIALVNIDGYRHFVVVKGVSDGEVLVGDPSLGLHPMPVAKFGEAWAGIYFAIGTNLKRGRSAFNRDAQWSQFSRAPSGGVFVQPLSQQALMLTAPFDREF